jgi:hypothetical protein
MVRPQPPASVPARSPSLCALELRRHLDDVATISKPTVSTGVARVPAPRPGRSHCPARLNRTSRGG